VNDDKIMNRIMAQSFRTSAVGRRLVVAGAMLLLCGGCEVFDPISRVFTHSVHHVSPEKALDQTQDREFPDERRQGIETLVDITGGKREPYTGLYMRMARDDSDYLVRATAVRALNRARWEPAIPLFISAMDDPNDLVRLEACKALVHMPDPRAIPGLLRLVGSSESNIDVRIAAANALEHYHQIEVARTLVAQLNDREFGVAWQAHQSLRTLTGRDLQYSEGAWLNYLTGPDRPLG